MGPDRRGLKPALVKPENLRLARVLNKKDLNNIYFIKTTYYKTVKSLFHY